MKKFDWGTEPQKTTQLNEEQLNEIATHVAHCMMFVNTKTGVYDYLEANASSKRVAIIAAMYLGFRMQQ